MGLHFGRDHGGTRLSFLLQEAIDLHEQGAFADARDRYAEIIRREPRTSMPCTFPGWRNAIWANSKTPSSTFEEPSRSLPHMPPLTTR